MKTKQITLTLLAAAALCACGGNGNSSNSSKAESASASVSASVESQSSEVSSVVSSESSEESDPLAWQEIGGTALVEIYGDIGATLSYGGKTFGNGDYIHFDDKKAVDYVGVFANKDFNFVYVLRSGETTTCIVNRGITSDNVAEYYMDVFAANLKGKDKGYIAISLGDTVTWNKNHSKAMNELIEKFIVA